MSHQAQLTAMIRRLIHLLTELLCTVMGVAWTNSDPHSSTLTLIPHLLSSKRAGITSQPCVLAQLDSRIRCMKSQFETSRQ